MKKLAVAAVVCSFLLAGCAVPSQMKENQKVETQAMKRYHKAEKNAYRAGEIQKKTQKVFVAATAVKVAADLEVKAAKKHLDEVVNSEVK